MVVPPLVKQIGSVLVASPGGPLAHGEDDQPDADDGGGDEGDGKRRVGHGAQRDAEQKQGGYEEQHECLSWSGR
jgi:hypothetical protein